MFWFIKGIVAVCFCHLVNSLFLNKIDERKTAERATECDEKSMIFDKDLTIAAEYAAYVAFRVSPSYILNIIYTRYYLIFSYTFGNRIRFCWLPKAS